MKNILKIFATFSILLFYEAANAQIYVQGGGDTTICNGQSAYLGGYPTASGGTPPYTYAWSNGVAPEANPIVAPATTTTYTVTVTDHVGLTATGSDVVTVVPVPTFTLAVTNGTANYFRIDTLTATLTSGGTATFTWYLSNGISLNGIPTDSGSYVTYNYPDTFIAIANNSYCTYTNVKVVDGGLSVSIASQTNPTCSGNSDGAIDVTVTGGTGAYTYQWNNGANTQNLTGLSAGLYSLTVYDNLGNVGTISANITSPAPVQANIVEQPVNNFPDTLSVDASGGTGTLLYRWSNGSISPEIIINSPGIYSITVTDGNGCSATAQSIVGILTVNDTFRVAENSTSTIFVLQNDIWDSTDYSLYPLITGVTTPEHGTSAYTIGSVTYTPFNNYTGPDSFTYTTCLGDTANGLSLTGLCSTGVVYVTVIDSVVLNISTNNAECPNTCDGRINLQISGGISPYTIRWSNGDTLQTLSNLCSGSILTVTVTDANHDSTTGTAAIGFYTPPLEIYTYTDTTPAIITAVAYNFGDSTNWVFDWSTGVVDSGVNSSTIATPQSGYYCVTATETRQNCIFTDCDTVGCPGCVWPGDANDDGIANNLDILAIGLGYGDTGAIRPNASNTWTGQPCTNWTDTIPGAANAKFADCNGDGVINANDTLPVKLNYGLIHLRSGEVRSWRSGEPALSVNLSPDTLNNGETVTATFSLGSADLPANNVYGLAFTFNYDPLVVDSTQTQISFGDSWLGTSANKISLAKNFGAAGQLECALTRINHTTASGNGPIGVAEFVITTDNINGLDLAYYNMFTWISDLTVIDSIGNVLQFNQGADTAAIVATPAGIKEVSNNAAIKIFPNPVHDQLIIQSQNQLAMQEITLIDLLGDIVITQPVTQPYQTTIDVSSLSSGTYFVRVETADGTVMKRFVVAR